LWLNRKGVRNLLISADSRVIGKTFTAEWGVDEGRERFWMGVGADSVDNGKDWLPMPVYHRQQAARAPAACGRPS
jgi:hypothetical protein